MSRLLKGGGENALEREKLGSVGNEYTTIGDDELAAGEGDRAGRTATIRDKRYSQRLKPLGGGRGRGRAARGRRQTGGEVESAMKSKTSTLRSATIGR